jgi:phage terminase Nu1 subunit (DNA packaging protein)
MTSEEDDWLEAGDSESEFEGRTLPPRGEVVNKSRLAKLFNYAVATIDKMISEGLPVVSKGERRAGYQINTADAHKWIVGRAVAMATGNEDVSKFDSAKARDKDAQARLREYRLAKEMGETITRVDARLIYTEHVGEFRKRLLETVDQIPNPTTEQRAAVLHWLDVCFSEFSGLPAPGE